MKTVNKNIKLWSVGIQLQDRTERLWFFSIAVHQSYKLRSIYNTGVIDGALILKNQFSPRKKRKFKTGHRVPRFPSLSLVKTLDENQFMEDTVIRKFYLMSAPQVHFHLL